VKWSGSINNYIVAGGRTAKEIVQWLKKRTGPPATALDSVEACKKFADSNEVAVIGYFEDESSDKATAYINTADVDDSVSYGIVTSKDVAEGMEAAQDSIVVYKKFDDGRAVFSGDWTTEAILIFVSGEQLPLVTKFNDEVRVTFIVRCVGSALLNSGFVCFSPSLPSFPVDCS